MPKPLKVPFSHGIWWLTTKADDSPCMENLRGSCDPSTKKGRKWIYINSSLRGEEELEVLIHEMSHAADMRASEEAIEEQARVIASALYALGYRRDRG